MIDLMALEPQMISKDLRGKYMLFYGLPGQGKTSLAAQFKNVLIAGFEMGTNALNNVYVQPMKTWKDWKQTVTQLCKTDDLKEKFHTIAIDTADAAWDLCVKFICAQEGVENLNEIPWGQGYDLAKKEYQNSFRDLAYNGYGIIFTSHSVEKTYKNEKGEEYAYIIPALPNRPFDIVNKMVDIIGYIREVAVPENDGKVSRKRFMFMRDTVGERFLAKSRYKYIVPKVELGYDQLVNAIYDAIDKEVQNSGGQASESKNPYVERSFEDLMNEAKDLWIVVNQKGLVDKVNTILEEEFGKPTKFSEISPEQANSLSKVIFEIRSII